MKERPILFSAPMVRAILDGQKTTTRRVVKRNESGRVSIKGHQWHIDDHNCIAACPYGLVGDLLWVRETWQEVPSVDGGYVIYGADYSPEEYKNLQPWKPSIHQFRKDSRILLEITGVKVERLNQISNDDILREGIRSESCNICVHAGGSGCNSCFSVLKPFRELWDSINGLMPGKSWDDNPYVWAVSFKRVD